MSKTQEKLTPGELVKLNPEFQSQFKNKEEEGYVFLQNKRRNRIQRYTVSDPPLMFCYETTTEGQYNELIFLLADEILIGRLRKTIPIRNIFISAVD